MVLLAFCALADASKKFRESLISEGMRLFRIGSWSKFFCLRIGDCDNCRKETK